LVSVVLGVQKDNVFPFKTVFPVLAYPLVTYLNFHTLIAPIITCPNHSLSVTTYIHQTYQHYNWFYILIYDF
jgi:hypothetical protein